MRANKIIDFLTPLGLDQRVLAGGLAAWLRCQSGLRQSDSPEGAGARGVELGRKMVWTFLLVSMLFLLTLVLMPSAASRTVGHLKALLASTEDFAWRRAWGGLEVGLVLHG